MHVLFFLSAPPEFLQWPQSVSRPPGGSAVLTCSAQGVPEPHIIWLKNGKILSPGNNVKLTNNNTCVALIHTHSTLPTLTITLLILFTKQIIIPFSYSGMALYYYSYYYYIIMYDITGL